MSSDNHADTEKTKNKSGKLAIIVAAAILVIIAVVVAIILINSSNNNQEGGGTSADNSNIPNDSYVGKIDNATVKEAISEIGEETLNDYFDNYEYEKVDAYYDEAVADMLDFSDKSALFVDKANRLIYYSPNEIDRISAAFRQAYNYDKNDISILRRLYRLYVEADRTEQASQVKQEILDYYSANY